MHVTARLAESLAAHQLAQDASVKSFPAWSSAEITPANNPLRSGVRLDLAHREAVAAQCIDFARYVTHHVRPRRRASLGRISPTLVDALLDKLLSVTYCAGARAMRKNMKRPKSSAPSTSWMRNGSVQETVMGCPALVFATRYQPATHRSASCPS